MKTLIDWVNIPDEDKYGKFILMGYMSEEEYENLCSVVPVCGVNHYSMVPLECMETDLAIHFEDAFITIVDSEFIRENPIRTCVNQDDVLRNI